MDALAAYAALEGWVRGRRVLVLGAASPDGPSVLAQSGAAEVRVVPAEGATIPVAAGIDVWSPERAASAPEGSFDVVVCVEGFGELDETARRGTIRLARRLVGPRGVFVVRARAEGDAVDFWSLESELSAAFGDVAMLAQVPWQGYSVTPVLDADEDAPELDLVETLLDEDPEPAHFLAAAAPAELPPQVPLRCLLVPVGALDARPSEAEDRHGALSEALAAATAECEAQRAAAEEARGRISALEFDLERVRTRAEAAEQTVVRLERALSEGQREIETLERRAEALEARVKQEAETRAALERELERRRGDAAVAERQRAEQERALARLSEALADKGEELAKTVQDLEAVRVELRQALAEREELRRQLDVAVAEREGIRQLADRAEAELSVVRKRLAEQEAALAARIEEASRAQGEIAALRERLDEERRDRRAVRDAEAGGADQGRLLAEVAHDRDRLREELARRNREIAGLEEKLWSARDDVQRAQLEAARLGAQLEAAKERLAWTERAEAERAEEVARLSAALREVEVARAELAATLRAREEAATRAEPPLPPEADADDLRARLSEREAELRSVTDELERLRAERGELSEQRAAAQARADELAERIEVLSRELAAKTARAAELREALEVARAERAAAEARAKTAEDELSAARQALAVAERERDALQGRLESAALERAALERKLAEAADARGAPGDVPEGLSAYATMPVDPTWPAEAQAAIAALQAAVRAAGGSPDRLARELAYRATEQEHMLARLEAAEQRIWEMGDAADRHAARLAASLAQLEQTKEQLDEAREELQVTRSMLAAAEARIVEQERLLGSERAKLARAGLGPEGFARRPGDGEEVERVFFELNPEVADLTPMDPGVSEEIGIPEPIPGDRSSLPGTPGSTAAGRGAGVVVEALDESWDDDGPADG